MIWVTKHLTTEVGREWGWLRREDWKGMAAEVVEDQEKMLRDPDRKKKSFLGGSDHLC